MADFNFPLNPEMGKRHCSDSKIKYLVRQNALYFLEKKIHNSMSLHDNTTQLCWKSITQIPTVTPINFVANKLFLTIIAV